MAAASASDQTDAHHLDVDSCFLSEFIKRYNIPQTVTVTGPVSYSLPSGENISIQTGDILLLRAVITGSIRLSYYDPDTAYTRDVHLPVKFPGRFEVVSDKTDNRPLSPSTETVENPYENYVGKMYERVEDLVRDCPPYFKSTENFVDPLDPSVSFNAGDRFRCVTVLNDINGKTFLECKHMTGKLMRLPTYCKGQFQALQDKCFYTLSDLIAMAPVSRRLRLARDSLNGMYPIPGIKKDYNGDIHMHKPVSYVQVSSWKQLTKSWNLPLDLDLRIKHFAADEYETPVSHFDANRYTLAQFHIAYEDNFPVIACIQTYTDKPAVFDRYLHQRSPIVCVHKYDKVEKILAKFGDQHYVLSRTLKTKCTGLARKFQCVGELLNTRPGIQVMVKEDVACDVPAPFCLKNGDILCISSRTSYTVVSVAYKWNNTSEKVNVMKCDKLSQGKKVQRVKIPLDLQVAMEEVMDGGRDKPMPFEEFLQHNLEFPITVEFESDQAGEFPFPTTMTLCCSIRDPCLFVTRMHQRTEHTKKMAPSENDVMLEIPERHLALLSFERLADSEEIILKEPRTVCPTVESVSSRLFSEMEKADRSYETIAGYNVSLPSKIPYRRKAPRSRPTSLVSFSALSKSLPSITALLHHKKNKHGTGIISSDLELHESETVSHDEENPYEDVEVRPANSPSLPDQRKLKKSLSSPGKQTVRTSIFKKKSADG